MCVWLIYLLAKTHRYLIYIYLTASQKGHIGKSSRSVEDSSSNYPSISGSNPGGNYFAFLQYRFVSYTVTRLHYCKTQRHNYILQNAVRQYTKCLFTFTCISIRLSPSQITRTFISISTLMKIRRRGFAPERPGKLKA